MRHKPDNDDERRKEIEDYAVEPWMMDQLDRNWHYLGWGPHEDYMWISDLSDPDSPRKFPTWRAFRGGFAVGHHPEAVGDRSGGEVVGWYWNLAREVRECRACDGSGENSETKRLHDDWYDFAETGRRWVDKIEQPEADALLKEGRLRDMTHVRSRAELDRLVADGRVTAERARELWENRDREHDQADEESGDLRWVWIQWRASVPAEEVNRTKGAPGLHGHDAINRWICVRARAERLGVYGHCETCHGEGHIPVDVRGRLQLVLWVINPLTGQSYGVEIDNVERDELEEVYDFLEGMRDRLTAALDVPDTPQLVRDFRADESALWTQAGSVLERSDEGWASETIFDSWRDFCWPCDVRHGDPRNGYRIPEDHPKFSERYTGDPSWSLDDLNELVRVRFGHDAHGRRLERVYLWMILPRKGASKRITINGIEEADLPALRRWVGGARDRAMRRLDPGVTPEEA